MDSDVGAAPYWSRDCDFLISALASSRSGLRTQEADARLDVYGCRDGGAPKRFFYGSLRP
jgi:hypothetical protein